MAVYFIADNESPEYEDLRVKIGISKDIKRRFKNLQTGSPLELRLMGSIESDNDLELEKKLHEKYKGKHVHREWFRLSVRNVYDELRSHSVAAWISVTNAPFEVVSYDSDGIPEFLGAWQWMDVDHRDFCPHCGWGGGLRPNDNLGGDSCLKCGFLG